MIINLPIWLLIIIGIFSLIAGIIVIITVIATIMTAWEFVRRLI